MICENCGDADLVAAFSGTFYEMKREKTEKGVWYCVRRKSDPMVCWKVEFNGSCEFCNFLSVINPEFENNAISMHSNFDSGPSLLYTGRHAQQGAKGFGVVDSGETTNWVNQKHLVPKIPPFLESYECIRSYLSDDASASGGDTNDLSLVSQLKVLDCESRTVVVIPPGNPYLTLSYVWGNPDISHQEPRRPQTIEDAIVATLKLGFRYLWVDKDCINQNDDAEKDSQIRRMDRIYRNAYACIVAAAGTHSDHGLAGVSVPRAREKIQIDGLELVALRPGTSDNIEASKWWRRGWTFQEVLFSKRKVYFTESEVIVETANGTMRENFSFHASHEDGPFSFTRRSWPPPAKTGQSAILGLIEEYSDRELTHDSDIIEAFSGVYNAFSSLEGGEHFRHIWGIPMFRGPLAIPEAWFGSGLWWHAFGGNGGRRAGFPSWSWTGWCGRVMLRMPCTPKSYQIRLESRSGSRVSVEQFLAEEAGSVTIYHPLFIHVEVRSEPVQIRWIDNTLPGEIRCFVGTSKSLWISPGPAYYKLRTDLEVESTSQSQKFLDAYCLIPDEISRDLGGPYPLFRNVGEHWERIGDLQLYKFRVSILPCHISPNADAAEGTYCDDLEHWHPDNKAALWEQFLETLTYQRRTFRLG